MAPLDVPGLDFMAPGDVPQDYMRALIHGPQGSGKTTLASTIAAAGPTLFIDCIGEKGLRSFAGAAYAKNITVARPTSITMFDDLFWQLNQGGHGYKAVVIDSLTSVQKMATRFILGHDETAVREIKRGTAPASFQSWGQSLDIMVDTATYWFGLADGDREEPMHVIMTAQTKIKENEEGIVTRIPDVQAGALSMVLATPDYVIYTDTEENPDHIGDENEPPSLFLARFGSHPGYRTKARVPITLRGKIPPILGRKTAPNLVSLGRRLGIGGLPPAPTKEAAASARKKAAPAAETSTNTSKEN